MWDLKDKTVVITGATNGIGKAAALELAKHGPKLLLTFRNQELAEGSCLLPRHLEGPSSLRRLEERPLH